MSKAKVVFLLGIGVVLIPFLGVPYTFKMIIAVLLGISISSLGMFMHIEKTTEKKTLKRPRIKKSRATPMNSASTLTEEIVEESMNYQNEITSEEATQE